MDYCVITEMSNIHCCLLNECKGDIYGNWFLNCKFCKNPVYIQCMRDRDVGVKAILLAFGLAKYNSKGEYLIIAGDTDKVATFMGCFNGESSFSITCEVCRNKFLNIASSAALSTPRNTASSSTNLHQSDMLQSTSTSHKSEVILRPPASIQNQNQNHLQPKPDLNVSDSNDYRIYITKFDPETECNNISDFIFKKTSLQVNESFKVKRLFNSKKHIKPKSFVSFLVTASNSDNFDVLMNKDLWAPNFTATKFTPKKQMNKSTLRQPKLDVPTVEKHENKLHKQQIKNGHAKKAFPQLKSIVNQNQSDRVTVANPAGTSHNAMYSVQHGDLPNSTVSNISLESKQPCRGGCYNVSAPIWPPYYGNNFTYGLHPHQTVQPSNFSQANNHMPPFRMQYAPMYPFHPQMYPCY